LEIPDIVRARRQAYERAGSCTCILHIGKTEFLSTTKAQSGTLWQQRLFVGKRRLKTCFVTRILAVHKLTSHVPIDRGFLWVHSAHIDSSVIPASVDLNILEQ
jgi:hypothetical protein